MNKNAAQRGELVIAYAFLHRRDIRRILACLDGEARSAGENLYLKLKNEEEKVALNIAETLLRKARVIKFKYEDGLMNKVRYFIAKQQRVYSLV